jgi:hypothetical protein
MYHLMMAYLGINICLLEANRSIFIRSIVTAQNVG